MKAGKEQGLCWLTTAVITGSDGGEGTRDVDSSWAGVSDGAGSVAEAEGLRRR